MKLKSLLALLLALLLCLSIPTVAFADMDSPTVSELEGYVNQEDGILFYTNQRNPETEHWAIFPEEVIENGTKLILRGKYQEELEDDTKVWMYSTKYRGKNGYVMESDVSLNLVAVTPKEAWKFDKAEQIVVINPDGVPMYSGPDLQFEKLTTIPKGTEVTVEYGNSDDSYSSWTSGWSYITYNGISGWAETAQYGNTHNFCFRKSGESMLIEDQSLYSRIDIPMWDTESKETKNAFLGTVPAGTIVTYDLVYRFAKTEYGYVTYQGKTGWVLVQDGFNGFGTEGAVQKEIGYVMVTAPEGRPVYSKVGDRSSKTGETIPAYQVLRYDYACMYDHTDYGKPNVNEGEECWIWYRVSLNGKQVWIGDYERNGKAGLSQFWSVSEEKVTAPDGLILYAQPRTDAQQLAAIPKGATIQTEFSWYETFSGYSSSENVQWLYGAYQNQFGWVRIEGENEDERVLKTVESKYAYEAENVDQLILLPAELKTALQAQEPVRASAAQGASEAPPAQAGDGGTTAQGKTEKATSQTDEVGMVKASPRTIILGCVAAAVILTLVAAVTILLVRKKKTNQA